MASRFSAHAAGHAEGGEGGFGRWGGREEVAVGRIGTRPAALDVVDPEGVESGSDLLLLGRRKLDALRLLAVAQGGVEEEKAVAGHGVSTVDKLG